jgi:hypothetical protein
MIDRLIREIDPEKLWPHALISTHKMLPHLQCQRDPWVYLEYSTPEGVTGRLVYDSDDHDLWITISSGNGCIPPYFSQHMGALLPSGTMLVLKDRYRRWNVADFTVGVDERLRWRY